VPALHRRLRRAFRTAPEAAIADAIDDAVVQYARRPSMFDPSHRVPLDAFLYQATWRNVTNALRADRRRREREAIFVERSALGRQIVQRSRDDSKSTQHRLELVASEIDRDAVILWLNGRRRTEALAKTLGLSSLSAAEQRAELKRFHDRMLRRLARVRQAPRTKSSARKKSHA
jgi:hypothetical protein